MASSTHSYGCSWNQTERLSLKEPNRFSVNRHFRTDLIKTHLPSTLEQRTGRIEIMGMAIFRRVELLLTKEETQKVNRF